jgi:methionyl-tRNA synthetase
VITQWGLDAFRYYVVRELDIGPDGNWTDAGFRSRYQAELANGLGNLVNRSLSMIKRYREGLVTEGVNKLEKEIAETRANVIAAYRANSLQEALIQCGALVTRANQYIDQTSPFKMAKDRARLN